MVQSTVQGSKPKEAMSLTTAQTNATSTAEIGGTHGLAPVVIAAQKHFGKVKQPSYGTRPAGATKLRAAALEDGLSWQARPAGRESGGTACTSQPLNYESSRLDKGWCIAPARGVGALLSSFIAVEWKPAFL